MDLCGPLEESLGKAKYMATFIDDYSTEPQMIALRTLVMIATDSFGRASACVSD
jgi:hypothetical protein